MNYEEAMERLSEHGRFGIQLGLGRISALLAEMGNPQNTLRFIHIAGTNGKGSTATMLSNILKHSGLRTGLFISPYVLCFRERMQLNGEMISEEAFSDCAAFVFACLDQLGEVERPTQFELETAIAMEWYRRCACDYVCLEVGLGGRFDSTNVIPPPLLQIITSIGMDHTAILGETIEEIAFEKAGIIKGGTTVLYPLQDSGARAVIEARCEETGSQLVQPELSRLHDVKADDFFSTFTYDGVTYRKSLPGRVQVYNCLTVITAARALQRLGVALSEEDIRFGIEETHVPARMEVLWRVPLIMLDGSHNPDGALALEQSLQAYSHRPITLMMGVMQDKDAKGMLQSLGKLARRFIAVTPDQQRAMPAQSLAQEARAICPEACYYDDLSKAVQETLDRLTADDLLLVCGSLYLASEVRPMLLEGINRKWNPDHESFLEEQE